MIVLFAGCRGTKRELSVIRLSILRGPSAIAFAQWIKQPPVIDGKKVLINWVDAPNLIQSELINEEVELAALPMISAINLYNKDIHYQLLGCPIWGTLYLIGRMGKKNNELHVFGAGTTPDILIRSYLDKNKQNYTLNYTFSTASEITQALLLGKVQTAVLSEPFLSQALRRDSTLSILADLNRMDNCQTGFAQTAIVCSPKLEGIRTELDSLLRLSCQFANDQPTAAIRILEKADIFPVGMLTPESISRCKIHYLSASEAREEIMRLLNLILAYEPRSIGGKMPDKDFLPDKR
ncbi:MAG: ABC transporter substrate-binding protein [Tannerellaceae bacterium]